ncbi:SDR family NAD(P)-dependent oxidoreductase [Amycolatopsis sp. NPDC058986]|uniref:SDR family NAD(P)-dependent oxidoreductase n=1 Tax=unclassified Amycolatopsis TaxID=2618356 RepID=UPI00366D02B3
MFALDGVHAVVTGAARGIGLATATALAAQGAEVTLIDRDAAALTALDSPHRTIALDVTDHDALTDAVRTSLADGPGHAVLVNNAALLDTTPLAELTPERWERVHAVNLTAALTTIRAAIAPMRARGGRIVNVASVAGRQGGGLLGTAAYASSKAGLISLTRSAARELATEGITVNAVAPGPVDTGLINDQDPELLRRILAAVPVGRLGTAEDIAAAVCFLASAEANWITGAVLDVNGGALMA